MTTAEKTAYQAELFGNRVSKRYKHLRKWAKRTGVFCFRIYDRDIPEIPVALDIYEAESDDPTVTGDRWLQLYLYDRPYEKDDAEEETWLSAMAESAATALGISAANVVTKHRKHQKGENQYEKLNESRSQRIEFVAREHNERFQINLTDYLDTGLFFDHRELRHTVRDTCKGKRVLNLFCYTGAFSVYAAHGRASGVDSVDLSRTYLNWAKKNMALNGFQENDKYRFFESDVVTWLKTAADQYDIIILDPPTFSNSKKTDTLLDINRDWPLLVKLCYQRLNLKGILYFSTNSQRLKFEEQQIADLTGAVITDITQSTIPEDFSGSKPHRCWKIVKSDGADDMY